VKVEKREHLRASVRFEGREHLGAGVRVEERERLGASVRVEKREHLGASARVEKREYLGASVKVEKREHLGASVRVEEREQGTQQLMQFYEKKCNACMPQHIKEHSSSCAAGRRPDLLPSCYPHAPVKPPLIKHLQKPSILQTAHRHF
jgi:hypothetical protein